MYRCSTPLQNPIRFRDRLPRIFKVFEHLIAYHEIETIILIRQILHIHLGIIHLNKLGVFHVDHGIESCDSADTQDPPSHGVFKDLADLFIHAISGQAIHVLRAQPFVAITALTVVPPEEAARQDNQIFNPEDCAKVKDGAISITTLSLLIKSLKGDIYQVCSRLSFRIINIQEIKHNETICLHKKNKIFKCITIHKSLTN